MGALNTSANYINISCSCYLSAAVPTPVPIDRAAIVLVRVGAVQIHVGHCQSTQVQQLVHAQNKQMQWYNLHMCPQQGPITS